MATGGGLTGARAAWRCVPLLLVALLVVAGSCQEVEPSSGRITLLPDERTTAGSWAWNATCRVGPQRPGGCAEAGPKIGTAQLVGNAWNLGGTDDAGSVRMSLGRGGRLDVRSDLRSAPPCTDPSCITAEANTWVRGFPSVLYGIDQCNASISPPQSPELQLPVRIADLESGLVGATTYDSKAADVTYDVAYDLWLNPSDTPTPCRTDGTLEVMVWTDYDDRSLLPDEMKVGTASIPFSVDGVRDAGESAWSVYVSNVFEGGRTVPWGGTVWLVVDPARKVSAGTVSVDLGRALSSVAGLLEDSYGWTDVATTYWLDTIAFGIEFGPASADPYAAEPAPFDFGIDAYCLDVGSTVADAGCGD